MRTITTIDMAKPRITLKDGVTGEVIDRMLTNEELVRQAQERLVHTRDMNHETVPTTNHVQLMLDNIKRDGGSKTDISRLLLDAGYKRDVVWKIMNTIDMYDF